MLRTGWDWRTLQETPAEVVDEVMLFYNTKAEYEVMDGNSAN